MFKGKKKQFWLKYLADVPGILVGAAILGIAINMFLIPHQLAAGGISGLAVILFHTLNIPVGLTIIVANLPLFIASYFLLGPRIVVQSVLGTVFLSLSIELTAPFLNAATQDLLLSAVYGGVIMGVGLGLVFRSRGSTGGTALLSLILNKVTGFSTGQGLLAGDLLIIGLAIIAFGSERAMYAALALFISSWVIDAVQEGLGHSKAAIIITSRGEAINAKVMQELSRGVTRLEGYGGYTGENRDVILCVVSRPQVSSLKMIVHTVDPKAFVIIGNASEVHGEGFKAPRR